MSRTLRGDHCQCPACGEYFNSTRAFDKHRTGTYTPMQRRCLSPDEMRAKGMLVSARGWWLTSASKRPILQTHAITGAAIDPTPCPDSHSSSFPAGAAISPHHPQEATP
jgi:hypothetical protein